MKAKDHRRFTVFSGGVIVVSIILNIILLYHFFSTGETDVKTAAAPQEMPAPAVMPENQSDSFFCVKSNYYRWDESFCFSFNSAVNLDTLNYTIKPKLENVRVYSIGKEVYFSGDFQPATIYTVTIHAGLKSTDNKALEKDVMIVERIPSLYPDITFISKGPYLPLQEKRTLALQFCNVSKVRYTLWKFFENNLNLYDLESYQNRKNLKKVSEWEETLELPENVKFAKNIKLDHLLPEKTPGVYLLEVDCIDPGKHTSASRALVLTDLAVLASVDENARQAAVAVRRLSDRKPVANAVVTLTSRKNQFAGKAVTGPDGTAVIPFAPSFDNTDDRVNSLTAHAGKDMTFFVCDAQGQSGTIPGLETGTLLQKDPKAFVYTARGIYRPGEKVDVSLFVRRYEKGAMSVQSGTPLQLRMLDRNGREMASVSLKTDADGYADHTFALSPNAVAGVYTIQCGMKDKVWGSASILAGAFVPDRINVKVTSLVEGPAKLDETLDFNVKAHYYFGPEVENGRWRGEFSSKQAPYPAHWKGWNVGVSKGFASMDLSVKAMEEDGGYKIRYQGNHPQCFVPVLLTATGQVSEPGSRYISGNTSIVLLPTDDFIGIRQAGENAGDAVFEYEILPYVKGMKIQQKQKNWTVKLVRRDWEYVYNVDSGRREWHEISVVEEKFTQRLFTDKTFGKFRFRGLPSGNYIVQVEDGDGLRKTHVEFWHEAGAGTARTANPNTLDITLDKPLYRGGDTAKLQFSVPADGVVYAVYADHTIRRTVQQNVSAGKNILETVIPADLPGDVYFAGVTFEGSNEKQRFHSFGAVRLPVDCSRFRMDTVLTVPETARPGSTVPLKVRLQDHSGKPCAGVVQIMVCDEGVLSLTNFKTPDIFQYFWKSMNSGLNFYDVFGQIFPELVIGEDGQVAGDGVGMLRRLDGKSQFNHQKAVCMALKPVRIPASGTGEISFTVPEHLGALRFMAVASGPVSAGSADGMLIVRESAGAVLRLPRAAAPGDRFESTCTVFNFSKNEEKYTLDIQLPQGWRSAGNTRFEGTLKAGASSTVVLPLQIPENAVGLHEVRAHLVMGDVKKDFTEKMVLRLPRLPVAKTEILTVAPGRTMTFKVKKEDWKGSSDTVLSIFNTPLSGVEQALNYLNEYPYGCLEQTTATAFPMLAAAELVKIGLIPAAMEESARQKVQSAYTRILPMMLPSGGFAMWPGGQAVWPEGTVFAAHFLYAARHAGVISMDQSVEKRVRNYLEKNAGNADMDRSLRAYMAYVLACAGSHTAPVEAKRILLENRGDLAAFLAGAALVRTGYAVEGRSAMREALKAQCHQTGELGNISDKTSVCGMILTILMTEDPDAQYAVKLAVELQKSLRPDDSGWGVTQNNAWAVMGLAKFAAFYPSAPVQAVIKMGNAPEKKPGPEELRGMKLVGDQVTVSNQGKAPIFVNAVTRGIAAKPVSGGAIKLKRTLLDMAGKPVREIRHGDKIQVQLTIEAPGPVGNLAVCDLLPGGFEIEDPRLATRSASPELRQGAFYQRRLERLDDRFLLFGDLEEEQLTFTYTVRAVTRGTWASPELRAEAMYDAEMQGVFASSAPVVIR